MKNRYELITLTLTMLFVFGINSLTLADNAAQVDVKISYPYGQTSAVSRVTGGDTVNVYITLLDANGDPATAGPQDEMLWDVTATIFSNLGVPGSITPYQFTSDSVDITFDSPSGTGPVARAHVDYTGANPGTDFITVVVAADPDPIVATASVNVSAPEADGLVVRTYRGVDPPSMIYTDMFAVPYWQSDNFGASELAGATVEFTVVAVAGGLYTLAPELEGQEVTVTAYADYSADGNDIGTAPQELVPLAPTATVTFVNGIAEGTIRINSAGPAGLDVVLTAVYSRPPPLGNLETSMPQVDPPPNSRR